MSTKPETYGAEENTYGSPEIVYVGDVMEITGGNGGPLTDGKPKPNGYQDVESEPLTEPTTPTTPPRAG